MSLFKNFILCSCLAAGALHETHRRLQEEVRHFQHLVICCLRRSSRGKATPQLPIAPRHPPYSKPIFLRRRAHPKCRRGCPHHSLQLAGSSQAGIPTGISRRRRPRWEGGEKPVILQRGWNLGRDAVRCQLARVSAAKDSTETNRHHLAVPQTGLFCQTSFEMLCCLHKVFSFKHSLACDAWLFYWCDSGSYFTVCKS